MASQTQSRASTFVSKPISGLSAGVPMNFSEKRARSLELDRPSSSVIPEGVRRRPVKHARFEDWNAPIGGYNSSDDGSSSDGTSNAQRREAERKKRKHLRRKLRRKHHADKIPLRLPWIKWMHSESKNHTVAFMGEFVGTFMFLFFAFAGTQVANIGVVSSDQSTTGAATGFNIATLLYISLSFGFSLMVNAWVFFRISGGLFNPAVTLALYLLDALSPLRAVLLFIAQLTGATFSAYIVSVLFPTTFNVRTTLAVGTSTAQGLFIEALCTAELVFTIIMLAAEKHRATFIAPVGIGLALFISELVAVYYTGGSLNPARSFGPAAVTHDFDSEHWIYWVGPLIGALFAVGFYKLNKILEYELANPGQDGDAENDPTQNDDHALAQVVEERALAVEEIQAIEQAGGFDAIGESRDPSVMEMADPVMDLDEGEALRNSGRSKDKQDLEAQWTRGSRSENL